MDDRIEQLEARVAELERRLSAHDARPKRPAGGAASAAAVQAFVAVRSALAGQQKGEGDPALDPRPDWRSPSAVVRDAWEARGEGGLGLVGIGLVLVGLVLLFGYAAEQGWLTPARRVGFGYALALAMLGTGWWLLDRRREYARILMGGSLATAFLTTLAALELYNLVPPVAALALHGLIATFAFMLAVRHDDGVLASVGIAGGLLGPAALLEGRVPGFAYWTYYVIVVTWSGWLHVRRGWRVPLLVAAVAGAVGIWQRPPVGVAAGAMAGSAVLVYGLLLAVVPLLRSSHGGRMRLGIDGGSGGVTLTQPALIAVPLFVTFAAALAASGLFPEVERTHEIVLGLAGVAFLAVGRDLQMERGDAFAGAATSAAVALIAGAALASSADWRAAAAASVAAVAIHAGERLRVRPVVVAAHVTFGILGVVLVASIDRLYVRPPFDALALGFLVTLAAALLAARAVSDRTEKLAYLSGAFAATHVLLATELGAVASAPWLASLGWGALGTGLVLGGLARRDAWLQRAGLVSLGLVVIRLFAYDLANVGLGLRIVLFMGFGFLFLALSYLFRARKLS